MSQIHAQVSAVIAAPPEQVYAVLADYRLAHPAVLPKPFISDYTLEAGGQGAGTVIRQTMNVMRISRQFHITVTEPQPGRLLVESDRHAGVSTTFTIEPLDAGRQTHLTITSISRASPGLMGFLGRLFTPPLIRRMFKQLLRRIDDYLLTQPHISARP